MLYPSLPFPSSPFPFNITPSKPSHITSQLPPPSHSQSPTPTPTPSTPSIINAQPQTCLTRKLQPQQQRHRGFCCFGGGEGVDGCGDGDRGKELTYSVLYKLERAGSETGNGELGLQSSFGGRKCCSELIGDFVSSVEKIASAANTTANAAYFLHCYVQNS